MLFYMKVSKNTVPFRARNIRNLPAVPNIAACRQGQIPEPVLEHYQGIPINVCARVYLTGTLWLRLQLAHTI